MLQTYPHESRVNPSFGSILEYGIVMEAYSIDHTVKVRMTNGQIIYRCKVMSKEWTAPNPDRRFKRSGRRSLPPENSRVMVLKPCYSYDGAIVIGSDFVYKGNYTADDFASKVNREKVNEDYHITPGGWEITENRADGNITFARDKTSVTIRVDENGGLFFEDSNGNKSEYTGNGIKITDKNDNVIEFGLSSVKINNNLEVLK